MAEASTTLGVIHGSIDMRFNDGEPSQVCTFDLPVHASVANAMPGGVVLNLLSSTHPIKLALAERLREIAASLESEFDTI